MNKVLLIILLFLSIQLFGQTQSRDVVYLKNGSIVKGKITEMNPSENLKIQTADGSLFVYKMSEITKTEKEEFVGQEMNQNKTSSIVSQSELDNYFSNFLSEKRPALKFIGVSKKNGIKREVYGQKIYEIEYELIMDINEDIYVSTSQFQSAFSNNFNKDFSYTKAQTSGYEAALNGSKKKLSKGQRILANGTMNFEETDNGWRVTGYSNKNFKTVSENYVSQEMIKRLEKEKAILAKKLKSKLDWKKEDIDPIEFEKKYFLAENVPIFSYGNLVYTIKPSSLYKGRNDVTSSIQNTFYQAIESTNRLITSSLDEFNQSENNINVLLNINNVTFNFIEKGYQCNISINAKINGHYKKPNSYIYERDITISAKSSIYNKNMSKEESLNSALANLKDKFRDFIFDRETIQINFLRIETTKKGKIDKVIFEKPENFINTNKINFLVLEQSDLSIKNNKVSIAGKIGKCIFKGEINGNEIVCEINGRKNKQAFEKYLNSEIKIIGLSSF